MLIGQILIVLGFAGLLWKQPPKSYFCRPNRLVRKQAEHVHIHLPRAWFRWW